MRDDCRPIIAGVIASVGRDDLPALRRALRAAYPYGERKNFPYKIWCHEIRVQLGQVKFFQPGERRRVPDAAGQGKLF